MNCRSTDCPPSGIGRAEPLGPPHPDLVVGRARPPGAPDTESVLPRRKVLSHSVPPWARGNTVFFLTICCRERGANQLCCPSVAAVIWGAIAHRQGANRWFVHVALLMPDHLHALILFPRDEDMRRVVSNFKEITAKRAGIVWQRDFFDHRLRDGESWREKWDYIAMNPVRKGLIDDPARWPYVWRADERSGGPGGPALPTTDHRAQPRPAKGLATAGGRALPLAPL